jgi:ankyrin repeat protein
MRPIAILGFKKDSTPTTTDDRGFTMLHQLALSGATGCVKLLLKHGADPNVRAKNGLTPLQLAKSLGWKQTIAVLEAGGASS